jgi:chaperonin cofactor prefoldin
MKRFRFRLPTFILALSLASMQARDKSPLAKSTGLDKQAAKTSAALDQYATQLEKTERALSSIGQAKSHELGKKFNSFANQVSVLEGAQKHATSAIHEMDSKGSEYRVVLEKSISEIQDPQLKQTSIERRNKLVQEHDAFQGDLQEVGRQLQPFMTNLHDIEAFLRADLRPANISNALPMMQKSNEDAREIRDRIAAAQTKLRTFLNDEGR